MALTFEDLLSEAVRVAGSYPGIGPRLAVGDPVILAELAGQARMLASLAEHVDVARYEPFERVRDSVVLADAAMRGVLPLARPGRSVLAVQNGSSKPITTRPGRVALDERGRLWQCAEAVTVQAGDSKPVRFVQRVDRTAPFAITSSVRYARIEVPVTGARISGVEVWRIRGAARERFVHAQDLCNVAPGDKVYALETDERRRLWVRFGAEGTIGYQPAVGDQFELVITECEGRMDALKPGAVWVWKASESIEDDYTKLTLASVEEDGADPPTMREMRMLARYPSVFNSNAVQLGNFDWVLRRGLGSGVRFLSTWNEQVEETFRGPSVHHVNRLFVAALVDGVEQPQVRAQVESIVRRADDSMRVVHVPVLMTPVPVAISATVSAVHDEMSVASRIRSTVLSELGDGSPDVSVGMRTPIRSAVMHRMLRESVLELRDDAADINITIRAPEKVLPEMFLFVAPESLDVTVTKYDGRRYGGWGIE